MNEPLHPSTGRVRRPIRLLLAFASLACIALGIALSIRQVPSTADADIVVQQARVHRAGERLLLDAQAAIQLPPAVLAGLDSGVPLDFIVELSIREPRHWAPDPTRYAGQWRFRLVYYELTRHYRLGSTDTGNARNYRSVLTALDALGTLRELEIENGVDIVEPAVAGNDAWQATLDMRLDTGGLPLPLRPLIGSSWRMRSAAYTWSMTS